MRDLSFQKLTIAYHSAEAVGITKQKGNYLK